MEKTHIETKHEPESIVVTQKQKTILEIEVDVADDDGNDLVADSGENDDSGEIRHMAGEIKVSVELHNHPKAGTVIGVHYSKPTDVILLTSDAALFFEKQLRAKRLEISRRKKEKSTSSDQAKRKKRIRKTARTQRRHNRK